MSISNNFRKAYNYMKRNGVKNTLYASLERLGEDAKKYEYKGISAAEAKIQREARFDVRTRFSIVVPAYETNEIFAREMIQSVMDQTYPYFELIITDASTTDKVEKVVRTFHDDRIVYIKNTTENKGISDNTNIGIKVASGQYIGLLDHDDLLAPNALYEMARAIEAGRREKIKYAFLYSNEDKCDSTGEHFYEPNYKPEFNLDLLLSNNYICHFLVMEASLMKKLELRKEFDGAQDHDLVLRAYHSTENQVCRVKRVLYHWRCHDESTASNPESKMYAYEAGKRAIEDFLRTSNISAAVLPTKHNGFFRVIYGAVESTTGEINTGSGVVKISDIFTNRFDVGVVGGPVIKHNKITGGLIDETRTCPFDGMNVNFSGYMHRAALQQDAVAVDVRKMYARAELLPTLVQTIEKSKYREMFKQDLTSGAKDVISVADFINEEIVDEMIIQNISWELCEACTLEGYQILYDPNLEELL